MSLAKAGTLSIIGVYPQTAKVLPIGVAMNRNLTVNMDNCNHRKYIPKLVNMIRNRMVEPLSVLTQTEPMIDVIEAYKAFDKRQSGWIKVELKPQATAHI